MFGFLHPGNFSDSHNMSHNEVILSVIAAAVVHSLNAHITKCYHYYCCSLCVIFLRRAYYLYVYVNFAFVVRSYLTSNFGTTKYFVIYESQRILPTKFISTFMITYQIAHS